MNVGSTTTTPFEKKYKKAVECMPAQGEFKEEDYDLGVLACATTSYTIAGQVCVPSEDSTLGGYCMDPPIPSTYYAEGRHLQKRFSDDKLFLKYCANPASTTIAPLDFCDCSSLETVGRVTCKSDQFYPGCDYDIQAGFTYIYDSAGTVSAKTTSMSLGDQVFPTFRSVLRLQDGCLTPVESSCDGGCTDLDGNKIDCPYLYEPDFGDPDENCAFIINVPPFTPYLCTTARFEEGDCEVLLYVGECTCNSKNGNLNIDCNGLTISTSQKKKPWKDLPFIQAKCNTPKPTKAPKPKKTPKPKKPRQLVSSETTDVDSAERVLIDPMNILEQAPTATTNEDSNAERDHSTLER